MHAVALECRIMRKFKNAAKLTSSADMEVNTQVSCTVPDQSLSIREILIRYANGTISDISLNNELVYSEDMPDLRGIDISELQQLKKEAQADVKDIEAELLRRKAAQKEERDNAGTMTIDFEDAQIVPDVKENEPKKE